MHIERAVPIPALDSAGLTALGVNEMMDLQGGIGSAELAYDIGLVMGFALGCFLVAGKALYMSGGLMSNPWFI